MKKIILHLGLPKTATTLLQRHVFTELHSDVDYIGVKYPRSSLQESLFQDIWELVCCKEELYANKLEIAQRNLNNRLSSNHKPLLISEECFCVNSGNTVWYEKIERLGDLFCGKNVKILITVRNPAEALYSLYVELYDVLKGNYYDFFDFAERSSLFKLYDYEYLHDLIKRTFPASEVSYIPFESLKNQKFIPQVFSALELSNNRELHLFDTNKKKKKQDCVMTNKKSLKNYIQLNNDARLVRQLKKLAILKLLGKTLLRIKVPFTDAKINRLTDTELKQLNEMYSVSRAFINSKLDVKY